MSKWKVRFMSESGTRRRDGLVFSREPVYLDKLTPGIEADKHLLKEEVPTSELKGATVTEIPAAEPAAEEPAPKRTKRGAKG